MNATTYSYFTQYGCWSTSPYLLSSGGNCCPQCLMTSSAGNNVTICPGNSTTLNGSSTPPASSYSWFPTTGLSNPNIANPVASPTQTTTYYLMASDGMGCTATDSVTVSVVNAQASVPTFPGVCEGSDAFALTGGSPSGGSWSGTGVQSGSFDPVQAGPGSHTLTYTAVDGNGCTVSGQTVVEVYPLPQASIGAFGPFCSHDSVFTLNVGTPAGGYYNGVGVLNGMFFPSVPTPGTHVLQYVYVDTNGCSDTTTMNFGVNANPATPSISQIGVDSLMASVPGDSFVWLLNGQLHVINGQTIQAPQTGAYTVIVWENGCASDPSTVYNIVIQSLDLGHGLVLEAWPNPTGGVLHVACKGVEFGVEVLDVQGKAVVPMRRVAGQGDVDLSGLPAGVYLMRVNVEGRMGTMRVVRE